MPSLKGVDNTNILLATIEREIYGAGGHLCVFKSNHTRTKLVNHVKDFGFYSQRSLQL